MLRSENTPQNSGKLEGPADSVPLPYTPTVHRHNALVRRTNQFMVCGSLFECPDKYIPLKPIGKGAYGIVCSAVNTFNNQKYAIKKIGNAFENTVDARRTLREIKLLRHLTHENIIHVNDLLPQLGAGGAFKDIYLVYELMDTDLHQIIRSSQQLSDEHCQYFVYQILRGLKYIHSAGILHRDLKPSNLLLNANCDLKICDFGLARTSNEKEFMTEYVVTRWYRAPELLLSCHEYTAAIDIWSVGCILAELLGRKPLFPGRDYIHQLNLITAVIGTPEEASLGFISSEKARRYIRSLPQTRRMAWSVLYPHANPKALDLLGRMLVFDPAARISVEEALAHPYLASLHDVNDEPICPRPFKFDMDTEALSEDDVRALVAAEVLSLNPDLRPLLQPPGAAPAAWRLAAPLHAPQAAPAPALAGVR